MKHFKTSNWVELAFIAIGVVFFVESMGYNPMARLIPQILSVLLIIFVLLIFLVELVPAVRKKLGFLVLEKGVFTSNDLEKAEEESAPPAAEQKKGEIMLIPLILWLLAFAFGIRYIDYVIVVPVWVFLFVKIQSRRSWLNAVALAIGTGAFNYILFDLILQSSF